MFNCGRDSFPAFFIRIIKWETIVGTRDATAIPLSWSAMTLSIVLPGNLYQQMLRRYGFTSQDVLTAAIMVIYLYPAERQPENST